MFYVTMGFQPRLLLPALCGSFAAAAALGCAGGTASSARGASSSAPSSAPSPSPARPDDAPPREPAGGGEPQAALRLSYVKDILTITGGALPGGKLEVWYLEAFCRSGSTQREWAQTVIPQRTELLEKSADGTRLKLLTRVEGDIEVVHEIQARDDEVEFQLTASNVGTNYADVVWAQPCLSVAAFTGREQSDYFTRCFIFVDGVFTALDHTHREVEAIYKGGQVYVPAGVDRKDVNPRPLSPDVPSQPIIGCFSADGRSILAMAWEPCQELFQGVRVCIHADIRIGGLQPGEKKRSRGKIYVLRGDPEALLARYRKDFAE
jgi:hypothetical protein